MGRFQTGKDLLIATCFEQDPEEKKKKDPCGQGPVENRTLSNKASSRVNVSHSHCNGVIYALALIYGSQKRDGRVYFFFSDFT